MARVEKTVFISYRRTNAAWALAIYQDLTQHGFDVFFDYFGLGSGDFEQGILGNIRWRAHFVIVLTPSALERCTDPADWVRREIETALDTQRNIVPLMLEGFDFSTPAIASQLTGKLEQLSHYNGITAPPEYFREAMSKLRRKFLDVPLEAVLHPASSAMVKAVTDQEAALAKLPAVLEDELTAEQWFERGFETSDPAAKVRFYDNAIRLKPGESVAFNNRGNARQAVGDSTGALADYAEAIRLNPDEPLAFSNRGNLRRLNGDLVGAINDCTEAIRLDPKMAEAFVNRGNARADQADIAAALADYDQAILLKPDLSAAFYSRANARRLNRDFVKAIDDYTQAAQLAPKDPEIFNNRAITRAMLDDLKGALEDLNEAIRLQPDYTDAFQNRGHARRDLGDLAGAKQDFAEAARLRSGK